jgi:uncharacterized protein (DUF488 family)
MVTIYTVGHSTRSSGEFRELLETHQIKRLVDVRQYPASRRHPHFAAKALAESLAAAGIEYAHEADLGGRRKPLCDSPNLFWRNDGFRGFADYMASPQFTAALERVIALGARQPLALACAEAVPWRCHRWLISDALAARGAEVMHIIDATHSQQHVLNPNARIDRAGTLTYPAPLFADQEQAP